METILFFIVGWIATLSGVALGAYVVFKTKRDPYEPFFGGGGKGEAFNLDDGLDFGVDTPSKAKLPKATEEANNNFVNQFVEDLATKVSK